VLAAAALLLIAAGAVVLATRGGAPPDASAPLVPPDALAYVHARPAELGVAGRFASLQPELTRAAAAITPKAAAIDFARDVKPWLGEDAAFAQLPAGPMLLATVTDKSAARALLERLGATPAEAQHGVAVWQLPPKATAAFAGDQLVVGPEDAVRGAIDRAAGKGGVSLADTRVFKAAAKERGEDDAIDAFAPATGLRRLLEGRALAAALVADPRLDAVTARVRAEKGGVRVSARLVRTSGASAGAGAVPSLARAIPSGTAAFADLPGLDALAGVVERSGGAAWLERVRDALPRAAGLELDDLLAPMSGEAALSVTAGEAAPVVTLAARTSDPAGTRAALAQLQRPVSRLVGDGGPFAQRGTTFTLAATSALQPSYGVSGDVAVASTAPSGLGQLRAAQAPVTGSRALRAVMPGKGAKVEALVFLDPRQLLALGERTGLPVAGSPAVRDDLGRIRAAAAVVEEDAYHPTDTTAELFLEIP
jgi:hypothetical protein